MQLGEVRLSAAERRRLVYTVATLAILSPPVPHGQKAQLTSKSMRAGERPAVASDPAGYHSVGKFFPSRSSYGRIRRGQFFY